jgi:hypothetical protein
MSLPFDATLKDILSEAPADLCKAFRLPIAEPMESLNVDLSTISAATDIAIGYGEPVQEIVDLNFQSGPDPHIDARVHLYNAAFHLRFHVPVRSLLILLRPKAETPGLTGKLTYLAGKKRVIFPYEVIRMWREPVRPFLEGGLALLPLAMLCATPSDKPIERVLRDVAHEIDRRLASEPNHAQAVRIMTGAFRLAHLRVAKERVESVFEGVGIMHEIVAVDQYEDAGRMRTARRVLLSHGRQLFGEPTVKTVKTLNAIDDPDRLDRMTDVILSLKSWKALLAVK